MQWLLVTINLSLVVAVGVGVTIADRKKTLLMFAGTGNGFTFEAHAHSDFVQAVRRALNVYNNQEDYEALRKSARKSVLDMEDCALGWIREFVRIRKRIWAQPEEIQKYRDELKEKKRQQEQDKQQQQQTPTSPSAGDQK